MSILTGGSQRLVIAFDGDDTLWINDDDQRNWERDCRQRDLEGLPHPGMSEVFRQYLREFGCLQDGVARALHSTCWQICEGEPPSHWSAQVEAIPEMTRALNLRYRSGSERVLKRLRGAGYTLWLITKGDLIRQAIKLSCLPFVDLFDVVEIVDRKNVASYRRVLAANHCSPSALTMVGDAFWEDVAPVVLLGGRAVHVPINRWSVIQRLESVLPTGRIGVCGHLEDVPRALAATDWANTGARAPNQA